MKFSNSIKSITNLYKKLSNFGKILIFISLLLVLVVFFKYIQMYSLNQKEGFIQEKEFIFKKGPDIYDDFYASIYDHLVFNDVKNDYEVGVILNQDSPNNKSVILDVGCGTGHHVSKLSQNPNIEVLGVDNSSAMILEQ